MKGSSAMRRSGHTAVELLIVIIVLGVFTAGIISFTSYAYQDRTQGYYEEITHLIEKQAKLYGESLDNLKEEENLVIIVDDLVKNGYYMADDNEGNVVDPRNSKATLNGLKIKLSYNNGDIKASVINED